MPTCPVCRQDNPAGAWFCNACGSPLDGEARPLREERKVVTVLFADLVGSTARSERMDPEDVQRLLQPYHAHLRSVLEMQWLFGMSLLPEVCRYLDDPEGPSAVYARLQRFGRLNATLPPELCRGRCPEASGSSPQPWPGGRKPWTTSTSRSG